VRLTTSPSSRAECHEIWEPKPPGTLWATPGLLRDSFTFTYLCWLILEEESLNSISENIQCVKYFIFSILYVQNISSLIFYTLYYIFSLIDLRLSSFNISHHMTFNVPSIVNDMGSHRVHTFIVPRRFYILA